MFGFSKIAKMELLLKDLFYYKAHYCGLCHGLAVHFNFCYKGLLGYDATLLALLHTAQSAVHPGQKRIRCPLNLFIPVSVVPPRHRSMRLAAAFTVIMLQLTLNDNRHDGRAFLWQPLIRLNSRAQQKAAAILAKEASFDTAELENLQQTLFRHERRPDAELEALAAPTGLGLGQVFAAVAAASDVPQNAAAMSELGYRYGRIIYLLDNLQDLEKDRARGRFNPLLRLQPGGGPLQAATLDHLGSYCQKEYEALQQAYAALTFLQHDRLLQNIFFQSLPLALNKALNRGH